MYNQPCTLAQIQAREADIRALAELARSLDKKVILSSAVTFDCCFIFFLIYFLFYKENRL